MIYRTSADLRRELERIKELEKVSRETLEAMK